MLHMLWLLKAQGLEFRKFIFKRYHRIKVDTFHTECPRATETVEQQPTSFWSRLQTFRAFVVGAGVIGECVGFLFARTGLMICSRAVKAIC